MTILQSKKIAMDNLVCCPKMDLIGILSNSKKVAIYRTLDWQQLLVLKDTNVDMKCITWSPNGLYVAIGHFNGKLKLFDIEKNEPVELSTELHTCAILDLLWINLDGDFTVLAAADQSGTVVLYAFGTLPIGRFNLELKNEMIRKIHVSQQYLFVVIESELDGSWRIDSFKIAKWTNMTREMHSWSLEMAASMELLETLKTTTLDITKQWKDATRVLKIKLNMMNDLLVKYDCQDTSALEHMYIFACSGILSPALSMFISDSLNEQGLGRMQKAMAQGLESMQELVHTKLKKCVEELLLRLLKVRGLLKAKPALSVLGLAPTSVDNIVGDVEQLVQFYEKFQIELVQIEADFSLFFRWIHGHLRKLASLPPKTNIELCQQDQLKFTKFLRQAQSRIVENDIFNAFAINVNEFVNEQHPESISQKLQHVQQKWSNFMKIPVQAFHCTARQELPFTLKIPCASIQNVQFYSTKTDTVAAISITTGVCYILKKTDIWNMVQLAFKTVAVDIYATDNPRVVAFIEDGDERGIHCIDINSIQFVSLNDFSHTQDKIVADNIKTMDNNIQNVDTIVACGLRGIACICSKQDGKLVILDMEDE